MQASLGCCRIAILVLAAMLALATATPYEATAASLLLNGSASPSTAPGQSTIAVSQAVGPITRVASAEGGMLGMPGFTQASVSGTVDYGRIALASSGTTVGPAIPQEELSAVADAVAEWTDQFTIIPANHSLDFSLGTVTFSLPFSGSGMADAGGVTNTTNLTFAQYTAEVDAGVCASGPCTFSKQGSWADRRPIGGGLEFTGDPVAGFSQISVPFRFSIAAPLHVKLGVEAQAVVGPEAVTATASADFGHTLTWGGFDQVLDSQGNVVTAYTVASDSGFNYAAPVPEPSTAVLLAAGLGCVSVVRRQRMRTLA
jgi:hypothetical protein